MIVAKIVYKEIKANEMKMHLLHLEKSIGDKNLKCQQIIH